MAEQTKAPTQSQDAQKAQERKRRPEPAPGQTGAQAVESISFAGLLGDSAMELPVERHAALLSDPRFSHPANAAQRARMINELQRNYGNIHVQRVLEHISLKRNEKPADDKLGVEAGRGQSGDHLATNDLVSAFDGYASNVPLDTDVSADIAAKAEADALAVGSDDLLPEEGAYQPPTPSSKRAPGHELVYVQHQMSGGQARVQPQRAAPTTPAVPPFEVIGATTAAEVSRGELTEEAKKLWRRRRMAFTRTARRRARRERVRRGLRAVQSPRVKPSRKYSLRWCLNLAAWDYQTWNDLPDIKQTMKAGSTIRKALGREFDKVIQVNNPTGDDIRRQITISAIDMLIEVSQHGPNAIGQLVVLFSGHGDKGNIAGVDEDEVTKEELAERGRRIGQLGIHTLYILDCCHSGQLADLARAQHIKRLEARMGAMPEAARKGIEGAMERVRTLQARKVDLGAAAYDVASLTYDYEDAKKKGDAAEMARLRNELRTGDKTTKLLSELKVLWLDELMLLEGRQMEKHMKRLERAEKAVLRVQRWRAPILGRMKIMRRRLSTVLDTLGDLVNEAIVKLREETAPKKGQPPKPSP
jgi:hypothetical protein